MKFRQEYILFLIFIIYFPKFTYAQTVNKNVEDKIKSIFTNFGKNPSAAPTTVTDPDEDCECVIYYLCNGTHINTNGEGIIDIRESNGKCESYLDFCCKLADKVSKKIEPLQEDKHPRGCGWRNPNGVAVQTQGHVNHEAKFGEFPWVVAILFEDHLYESTILQRYKCGGSLIHPQVVITAAHCVTNGNVIYHVRAGEWDTQTKNEILPHQNRKVKSIKVHPQYYAGALYNDIALLILEKPFDLDKHIDVVCLPPQGIVVPSGTKCWASGWGKDLFGNKGKYQVILKNVDLPIVDRTTCENAFRSTRLGARFQLHESFVCAGGQPGKDMCQGDGGSPLVCSIPGQTERYQHIGIVAWGIGCGENGIPGAYGNVAIFRKWIDQEMALNNLATTQYEYQ